MAIHPREQRIILKYADEPGYTPDIDCYMRHGGYEMLKKAVGMDKQTICDEVKIPSCVAVEEPGFRPASNGALLIANQASRCTWSAIATNPSRERSKIGRSSIRIRIS